MSTTENAITAHLVLQEDLSDEQITALKRDARHRLEHRNISHATLETETTCQARLRVGRLLTISRTFYPC